MAGPDPRPASQRFQEGHAELDEATELDDGDPGDLGRRYAALARLLPRLNVVGGCCGTDHRHVRAICDAWPAGSVGTRS